MKKVFCIFLLIIIFASSAAAEELDVSKLSYEQLTDLYRKTQMEIMARPEWKEVQIPIGEWRIGEDIPAGNYTLVYIGDDCTNIEIWGMEKDDFNSAGGYLMGEVLSPEENTIGKVSLKDGTLLVISMGSVMMYPYKGLGF